MVDDFISEISLMESFKGVQNIVSVEDYKVIEKTDEIGWDIYIRMELLIPFNTFIQKNKIDEETIIKLGTDISTAIELCSRKNVIHRDIKPENIFVNSFGDFKLGDFGIARRLEGAASSLSQKGTYQYMAPEVQSGERYDGTVDIYSLGLVLYKLANNNRLPFMDAQKEIFSAGDKVNATRRRFSGERIPAPCGVSEGLGNIILKACEFEPRNRFQNAGEMKRALKSLQSGAVPRYENTDLNEDNIDKTLHVRRAAASYINEEANTYAQPQNNWSANGGNMQPQDNRSANGGNIPPQQPKRPNNSKKKIVIIAVCAIAAAAAIAAAIIFIPNLGGSEDPTEEPTTSAETTTAEETTAAETTAEDTSETTTETTSETTTETTPSLESVPSQLQAGTETETAAANAAANSKEPSLNSADTYYPVSDGKVDYPVVKLGTYEQDGDTSNGAEDIEWEVIYEENGNYLLISKYALDAKPYNTTDTSNVSWESCSLRSWLNNTFYNTAFSSTDKSRIGKSAKTGDYVSLLGYDSSGDSGVTYFMKNAEDRICYATAYAIDQGAFVTKENLCSPWWTRDMVSGLDKACMIKSSGEDGSNVVSNGTSSSDISEHTLVTVRPIIWVKE